MEWLSITRAMQPYLSTSFNQTSIPSDEQLQTMIENERIYLENKKQIGELDLKIPHNFETTAPAYNPDAPSNSSDILQNRKCLWVNLEKGRGSN